MIFYVSEIYQTLTVFIKCLLRKQVIVRHMTSFKNKRLMTTSLICVPDSNVNSFKSEISSALNQEIIIYSQQNTTRVDSICESNYVGQSVDIW